MLEIASHIPGKIKEASEASHLHEHLQYAIELEHATMPPYLTALYSIKPGTNEEAYEIIRSVVKEEMLHMIIACNVLNAMGGQPRLNHPDFIPKYPGPLPMGIESGLEVGLEPLSVEQVDKVFMRIEEPEGVLLTQDPESAAQPNATIGQFYQSIMDKIGELGTSTIAASPNPQVVQPQWFPDEELFPIVTHVDAIRALEIVIEQGEGTSSTPDDPDGEVAHYFRFGEIVHGKRLVVDKAHPRGYSYSGDEVPFDPDGVWPIVSNSRSEMYVEESLSRRLVDQFNATYSRLLNALQATFSGSPAMLNAAFGLMFELKLQAQRMVQVRDPEIGLNVAPAFEYIPHLA